ncbi:MAG: hypothetical protein RBR74_11640 [Ignavibacteriaceae bacterium]|jgi:hypothetical protein|nr:hypothetical protein [Ignavibacteriaceae bacterium]
MDEVEIPAEYATIKRQVIDTPGSMKEVLLPAQYKKVKSTFPDQKGGMIVWEEVDCNN